MALKCAMEMFDDANKLYASGRFGQAFQVLDSATASSDQASIHILKLELCELIGRHEQAKILAGRLMRSSRLTYGQRGACEHVLAKILLEDGNIGDGMEHLQRAASLSHKADNLKQLCWIQSKLSGVLAEISGPDAAAPLLAELRRNVNRLGDHHTTALAHVFISEIEARQGQFELAHRHATIATGLLENCPHVWLEALSENILLALSVLQSRVEEARAHSSRALELSNASGAAGIKRSVAANTGNLLFLCGELEPAFDFFEQAMTLLPTAGERNNGVLDALANIRLLQGRYDECEGLLRRIDSSIRSEMDRTLYAHRYSELTRMRLLMRTKRTPEARAACEHVMRLADLAKDRMLQRLALVAKAHLLHSAGRTQECAATLRRVLVTTGGCSAEVLARYEAAVAEVLSSQMNTQAGLYHSRRARRICETLTNAPCLNELNGFAHDEQDAGARQARGGSPRNVLQCVLTAVMQLSRPELVAGELAEALVDVGCAHAVRVMEISADGSERELFTVGAAPTESTQRVRIPVRSTVLSKIELDVIPMADFEAEQSLAMVTVFLERLNELDHADRERARHATLWPIEELVGRNANAVISGHMRELMTFAQRVARTTVNVLITGPSGTGKEILARAIHDASDRALKPFVPFNCAAVPRELLESQLFGHRRGAFTGADRDQLGLIRSAADGTLFLDEVGELSLDLQPKLLRFLESGEISPLGEPSPFTVNVRVVAATNANLEDAVRDGKFREDLFYRLNVVRLSIKPLRERRDEIPGMVNHFVAAAAQEYKKGHLQVAEDTMERLLLYRWPGNVRQLQNEIRRMVALAEPNSTLEPESISADILGAMPQLRPTGVNGHEIAVPLHEKLMPTLSRIEYEMIKAALRTHHGKVETAARALGISRKGLYLKRQRFGL